MNYLSLNDPLTLILIGFALCFLMCFAVLRYRDKQNKKKDCETDVVAQLKKLILDKNKSECEILNFFWNNVTQENHGKMCQALWTRPSIAKTMAPYCGIIQYDNDKNE
ncbi:MAG: hypothetical protein UT05_C0002G0010 [Parcubacteria group bacterium GW2011_GWF2_38_76]|nr:MAG: hypothetical protein UT05_C0002G0010 [Parcubacteria group bacterium GW2011_GWF2_38_76]HBM45835.1 hypothetical protein [Patescibacteria group bacterium]